MCYVGVRFHGWLQDLFFAFIGVHVIDPGILWFSTVSCIMSGDAAVKALSFGSRALFRLDDVNPVLFFWWVSVYLEVVLVVGCICLCLASESIVESIVWKSGSSYVHLDWSVVILSWGIGRVVLLWRVSL